MKKLFLFISIFIGINACVSVNPVKEPTQNPTKAQSISKKIPLDPHIRKGKLANGLTYYIRNNGKPENKVELRLAINAGSVLEDEDQLGLAHFMEHMNFNGTKHFEKNKLVDYLQSIGVKFGADLNAYTGFDETVYILPIPSDDEAKLESGFTVIEDWAFNALLTEDEIDKERGVVLEEYRLGLGAEKRMLGKYLPKIMFHSKYAERLPIGKKEILENFKPEVIRRFHKDWYRPDLMAVIAVGDVDLDKLEAKIKEHFAKYPAPVNPRERKTFTVPNHQQTLIAVEKDKEATFNRVQLLYKDYDLPKPEITEKDYREAMLKSLFSEMINNRLDELRNSENPPFVYGYSYYGGTWARSKNAYQSFAMTDPNGQLKALKVLLEENERIKRYGFMQGEFERAKKNMMARMEKYLSNIDKTESKSYVREYIRNFLEQEPIPGIEWEYNFYKKELPGVQLEEVKALINRFLHDDNRVIVLTGSDKTPDISEQQILDLLQQVEKSDIQPYKDTVLEKPLLSQLPPPGKIVNENYDEMLDTHILTLSNGSKVIYKKTHFKDDEVLMHAFSYGGQSLLDLQTLQKVGHALSGLPEAGVNGFSKNDLQKALSGKIVDVSPSINLLSERLRGKSTPKDLETLFQLTHLYFTALNKDPKAFNSFVAKQKAFLGNILSNPNYFYQIKFQEYLNKDNPRYIGFPDIKDWDNADYDMAYKVYKERFANAGDFNFYFVGNLDENKLHEFAAKYLANLPGTGKREHFKDNGFKPMHGTHEKVFKKGTEPKSYVTIRFAGPAKYDEKEAYNLKNLGEILSIKLIEVLREDESGVYGVGARGNMEKYPSGSYSFTISFPCGPENVEKLKKSALAELQKIIDKGPTEKDIHKIKETQLLHYKEHLKQNKWWIKKLEDADFYQRDASTIVKAKDKINTINAKDIQAVAKKYTTGGYIFGVLYPKDKK